MEDIARRSIRTWTRSCRPAASRSSRARRTSGWRKKYKSKIADGSLALVVADTLPIQIDLLKAGSVRWARSGQRPFEMGYKAMLFLNDIKNGKPAPADPTYTGLDVCTPKNVATCIGS